VGRPSPLPIRSSRGYLEAIPHPPWQGARRAGALEPNNEWCAIAKTFGLKLARAYYRQRRWDFARAMSANIYGTGDNFVLSSSHVLADLIRKVYEAGLAGADHITIWEPELGGREFLRAGDRSDVCVSLMKTQSGERHISAGSDEQSTILDPACFVCRVVRFAGNICNDLSKRDGRLRKLTSANKLRVLGWRLSIGLRDGPLETYREIAAARLSQSR
jgi:GDP-L-fucose synthase